MKLSTSEIVLIVIALSIVVMICVFAFRLGASRVVKVGTRVSIALMLSAFLLIYVTGEVEWFNLFNLGTLIGITCGGIGLGHFLFHEPKSWAMIGGTLVAFFIAFIGISMMLTGESGTILIDAERSAPVGFALRGRR